MNLPRVGLVQLWQEVNTYSPRVTSLDDFVALELSDGERMLERHRGAQSVVAGFLATPEIEAVPVFSAAAWPGGPATAETADALLDRLRIRLGEASPLDGVLMNLHGAMVCEGRPDMELEVVAAVRGALGGVPTGCVLDLHGIPSTEFVAATDVVVGYDTYPHVDMFARGLEVATMLAAHLRGRRLRSAIAKLPLLTTPLAQATDTEPMNGLLASARGHAAESGLARVSLLPGFPYSDVARAGFSVVGVAEQTADTRLEHCLDRISEEVRAKARLFELSRPMAERAVELARQSEETPVVIADLADNVGGGGAGDGTALLRELLRQRVRRAIVTIADREVALAAAAAGPGGQLAARVGAKLDRLHGEPVEIDAEVVRITDGRYVSHGTYLTGQEFTMGTTAHLRANGIDLVVCERAVPPFHVEQLTHLGLDPAHATVITAKGAVAWRSAFGEIAARVIEADTPGVTPLHPGVLPREYEPVREPPMGAIEGGAQARLPGGSRAR